MNEKELKKAIAETRRDLRVVAEMISNNEAHKREFPSRVILYDGNIATLEDQQRNLRMKLRELLGERDERKLKQTAM